MAIDYETPLGQTRALIPDTDVDDLILSDELINTYLALSGGRVFLAAALALEAIAVDETLTYKITRTDDLSVNGVTGAEQLLAKAKTYRAQQNDEDASVQEAFILTNFHTGGRVIPEASVWPVW